MDTFIKRILDKYNLNILFDKIYISSEMKLAKPDISFFNYVLDKENINPKEVLFIDDNIKNIEGAKKVKIDSILFKNNIELIDKIKILEKDE